MPPGDAGVEELRRQLAGFGGGRHEASRRAGASRTAVLLCLALAALTASLACLGTSLRQPLAQLTCCSSLGRKHVRLHVRQRPHGPPALKPYRHNREAHAMAELLRGIARSPAALARYVGMSSEQKEAFLAEQVSRRPTVDEFLQQPRCRELLAEYQPLVADQLAPWKEGLTVGRLQALQQHPSVTVYLKHGRMFLDGDDSDLGHPMAVLWADYLHSLVQEVKLPDLVLALNADDFPRGRSEPWVSFCRQRRRFNDLLLPNRVEDGLFALHPQQQQQPSRAGAGDVRRPMAAWLGRPMAWLRGGRKAVVQAGLQHPQAVYAGLTDLGAGILPASVQPDDLLQYYKPYLPLNEWADHFKYVINVEGNCGSARLAYQLWSDAAVFLVAGDDEEWYHPLLKPFVHYIPVTVAPDGGTDLADQVAWAERNPDRVREIVAASTAFASRHLRPGAGRDCYAGLLLREYAALIVNASAIEPPARLRPFAGFGGARTAA